MIGKQLEAEMMRAPCDGRFHVVDHIAYVDVSDAMRASLRRPFPSSLGHGGWIGRCLSNAGEDGDHGASHMKNASP
jgi:hypothetical protein